MVNFVMQIISGIFPGEGIIVEHGKIAAIYLFLIPTTICHIAAAQGWYVHVISAFPLAHHYRVVLAWDL